MSNTSESQLAATTSFGNFCRQRPRKYARVVVGGSAIADVASSSVTIVSSPTFEGQAALRPEVVVLEVDRLELGRRRRQAVAVGVALDEALLGDPVDPVGDIERVALEAGEHVLPLGEHVGADLLADRLQTVRVLVLASPLEQSPLQLERRRPDGRRGG